jgi:hypothetical protein
MSTRGLTRETRMRHDAKRGSFSRDNYLRR